MARELKRGDTISALGLTFIIDKIFYQDSTDDLYDVEFMDIFGGYHHWKQIFDGGEVILSR